jgi:ubiquinone/menaquinone biosynthesis C-methylase UbiE
MSDREAAFVGNIPTFYDQGLGPVFFADFADDIARCVAVSAPIRVLETAAGTGIVTRRLRDLLPREAQLTATDLNPPMLEVASEKFGPEERVTFQPADATSLPFPDNSFDALVCQFGVMFFPDKDQANREAYRVLARNGRYVFSVWDSHRHNPVGRVMTEIATRFFPVDPPQFIRCRSGITASIPSKTR